MTACGSRRFIATRPRWPLPATRQKLASTPTRGACSTIRRSTRPIVSSMAVMIPVPALYYSALGPNGCSATPRRRSQASPILSLAERIAHPFTLSLALTFFAVIHLNRREPERALSLVEAAEALAAEQRLSLPFEPGMVHGAALVGQGAAEEGIARIREGIRKSPRPGRPYGLAFLAEGLALHGDRAAALAELREGLETTRATGEHGWDAELHRLAGT